MRKLMLVLILVSMVALSSCATDKQNLCKNAQFGYTLSVAMLDKAPITDAYRAYWEAYKVGAQLALQTYCFE